MAHATTVSIQKLCVGQLFCVGAALVAAHPRATTRVAPTAAPALSGYEWSQVGVFLLPPLMHRFNVDTVLLLRLQRNWASVCRVRLRTVSLPRLCGARSAPYCCVYSETMRQSLVPRLHRISQPSA